MSESETDDTPQIGSEPYDLHDDPKRGYSLSEGAPRQPTLEDLLRALMLIDVEEACAWKWKRGKKEHRSEPGHGFVGDATAELHAEGIDALNYLQVLMDAGVHDHDCLEHLRSHALGIVRGARLLAQGRPF